MSVRAIASAGAGGAIALAVLLALGVAADPGGHGAAPASRALTQPRGALAADAPRPPPPDVRRLPCFRCHNLARYRNGTDFSHADHESVGHCHMCHAFEGHFQATIRRQTCEDCH